MFNLRVLKENNKRRLHSYNVRNSVLIISHITFRDCRVHIFPTTFLEIAVYVINHMQYVLLTKSEVKNYYRSNSFSAFTLINKNKPIN